uniref:uncharacterized protein LOC122593336 n=1 Tax=Erigeron canadensis TaxID=72917 RepID=UPI001CB9793A|nr:uncharacterized protein LOC122593336 [Erigeron canadensis]
MEPSPQEDVVCQTCGDRGITDAFVYCGQCLQAVIHRYCLLVMPKTRDECVIWHCEDCKIEFLQSKKVVAANSLQVKSTHPKKKEKKEKKISSLIAQTEELICKEYITECEGNYNNETKWVFPSHIPKKQRTNRKKFENFLIPKKKEDYNVQIYATKDQIDGSQPSKPSCKHEKLNSDSPHMEKESEKATLDECDDGTTTNICQSVDSIDGDYYRYALAQPDMDPIWRGDITILGTSNDLLFKGFAAHASNKACHQVIQEAKMLPALLHLEMLPKSDLWPKSFKESPPSDDKIGLYFFSGDPVNGKAYDRFVRYMMDDGLAMRTSTKNAELLIFTSIYLPPLFWRYQGKYYLWGVFKGKRNGHTSQDPSIDIKKMLTRVKTLDACSPRSPLSNNGDNGGVDMDTESGG